MNRSLLMLALALALPLQLGCGETGQDPVSVPLRVAGSDLSAPITTAGGHAIRVARAELAFGPLYLCAGNTAGDLCDAARLEWLGTTAVDLADPTPLPVGELEGTTGTVRSWMYDLGISSQLTASKPVILDAAEELGGYSIVVEGSIVRTAGDLPFRAAIAISQTDDTELGVPVIRKSTDDPFVHDVDVDEPGLLVRFDAAAWLRTLDLRGAFEDAGCTQGGSPTVCAGDLEQTCDADGEIVRSRDCIEQGQACLAELGCQSTLVLDAESEGFRALRNAVTSGARPRFSWSRPER